MTESTIWKRGLVQLIQSAEGIGYLHSHKPPIVHGDLKAENILINNDGDASLCDFGLSRAVQDSVTGLTTGGHKGSFAFLAPELYESDEEKVSTASDIYAFGGLIIQVRPLHHCLSPFAKETGFAGSE